MLGESYAQISTLTADKRLKHVNKEGSALYVARGEDFWVQPLAG